MKFLTQDELNNLYNPAAAQPETPVEDLQQEKTAAPMHTCKSGDMQCIINRHKTASALHNVLLVLLILLLLKWLMA